MNILLQWAPFMPPADSHNAVNVDLLYGFIFWLSIVLFILVRSEERRVGKECA